MERKAYELKILFTYGTKRTIKFESIKELKSFIDILLKVNDNVRYFIIKTTTINDFNMILEENCKYYYEW